MERLRLGVCLCFLYIEVRDGYILIIRLKVIWLKYVEVLSG